MGRWLVVKVPESDRTPATIDAFYEYALEQCEENYDPELVTRWQNYYESERDRRLKRLEEREDFAIESNMPRDCHATDAWDRFIALFEPETGHIIRTISDPDELDVLATILENMKSELKELAREDPEMDNSPAEWDIMFETGIKSLPDFAREHGYGVRAPY